jgi:hypothetical protein
METVLVQINNDKAYKLLEDLEDLNLITLLKEEVPLIASKLADKYRGVFLAEDAASFDAHTKTMRTEWNDI